MFRPPRFASPAISPSRRSAGGQLEQPSELNSSTTANASDRVARACDVTVARTNVAPISASARLPVLRMRVLSTYRPASRSAPTWPPRTLRSRRGTRALRGPAGDGGFRLSPVLLAELDLGVPEVLLELRHRGGADDGARDLGAAQHPGERDRRRAREPSRRCPGREALGGGDVLGGQRLLGGEEVGELAGAAAAFRGRAG